MTRTTGRLTTPAATGIALLEVGIGLAGCAFALFPPLETTPRGVLLGVGFALIILAVLTVTALSRVPDGWGLDASLLVSGTMVALSTARFASALGQAQAGMTLLVVGVVAAYYRPRRRALVMLGVWVVVYVGAVRLRPHLDGFLNIAFFVAILVIVPVLVSAIAQRLRDQAVRDPLTGLLNRRGLSESAASTLSLAERAGVPVTTGLLDLDEFKKFNDLHGHLAGDELLVDVTRAWQGALRQGDVLARFGGDEFALILPDSTPVDAQALVGRLRGLHPARFTAGFAMCAPAESFMQALDRADTSLYQAKGRKTSPAE